jgi:alkylation response protein AidB-like acyl-CoA dehydrogenase
MDFALTDEQEAIRGLARQIFADRVTHERLRALEDGPEWFDLALWKELGQASVPGTSLPERYGGSGLGLLETCIVLEELGRALAPVPLLPTVVLGALPIAEFGSEAQRAEWLPGVVSGDVVLSAALQEETVGDPTKPRTSARRAAADTGNANSPNANPPNANLEGEGWILDGEKICVQAAHLARRILVPARTGNDRVGVFLVDPSATGVTLERQLTVHREPQYRLTLSGVAVGAGDVLGDPENGAGIVEWMVSRGQLALCAIALGVAEESLRRTAEYASSRKQFGRQIGAFQGVALRAADGFIDVEAMRSVFWQAVWRVEAGVSARAEVAAAKWWACRAGHRVVHTAQHIHGGIGADTDYPIHRYFFWSQHLEVSLGGASEQLAQIGAWMAQGPGEETSA